MRVLDKARFNLFCHAEKRLCNLPTIEMVGYGDNKPVFTGF